MSGDYIRVCGVSLFSGAVVKHKTDHNQAEIVEALRAIGASVQDLSAVGGGCPDLACGFRGQVFMLEIKNPATKGKLNVLQKVWHKNWNGHVAVVRTVEEALREIGAIE